ncbi:probable galacturonosyltransferase 7 isoform X3 [Juglans microcarpa x Juglans regia]|uniref:probable galacturonosyltransferase 7 isoform X3 n=1 Tax=Juglans microcarpa x Juglans regia TaxID=2249226 RepID=UPI001B7F287B|nr:probable galacturonosyltransferase 7 isoform X3 [Juglans microcarpa x Juglans regia]
MKGGASSYGYAAKRRWRGLVIGVLGLVILSMLVPLVFLLGLHNGFRSAGYASEQQRPTSESRIGYDKYEVRDAWNESEDVLRNFTNKAKNKTFGRGSKHDSQATEVPPRSITQSPPVKNQNTNVGAAVGLPLYAKDVVDDIGKLCEFKFGSYCHWHQEHREEMKDSMVKKLKDQLFVARAFYPSIAKLPRQDKLSRELKLNIQELERVLSESTTDVDLPPQIAKKLQRMEAAIAKAKLFHVECNNVDKKLRQIYDMTEDEANFHMKQSAFLYQLAVQTMPKSLHCLSMRLTVEYFRSPPNDMKLSMAEKSTDPMLHHYVIFSNNVLASSVESVNQAFHVLTDEQNYFAMKLWFLRNTYKEATVQVLNIESLKLDNHSKATLLHLSLPEEFRVSFHSVDSPPMAPIRTEYVSIFSHSHYLLPKMFQNLDKVVVLDDDVVVQQDLSALWSLDMGGKVNAAVQFCSLRLDQLKKYLGENSYNKNSCAWMSGLNVIDLARWRDLNLTETFQRLAQEMTTLEESVEAVALRASLLSFEGLIYAIDGAWILSGLGHDYGIDNEAISKAAILHYNGNMKPWLELGIPKYKHYWKKFLSREDQFMSECNVNS